MLIVCDNCGAEYEIDVEEDALSTLPGRGLRFRCSACGHTFSIGEDAAQSGSSSLSGEFGDPPDADDTPPPMLLKQEGKVYQVDDIATLQRWIVERRVLREDLISLGGLKWEPVGVRRELQVFFHLVEHSERATLSGPGVLAPPVGDQVGGPSAMEGAAPWELRSGGSSSSVSLSGHSMPMAAPEADTDEVYYEDDGVDAGLPIDDHLPEAWARSGGDALESHGDADSFFTEAGEAGLPVPSVPNLAAQDEIADDPESAGVAADEEVDEPGSNVPRVIDHRPTTNAESPTIPDMDRFLDARRPPVDTLVPEYAPPRDNSARWLMAAAAVVLLGGAAWYFTRDGAPPPGADPTVAEASGVGPGGSTTGPAATTGSAATAGAAGTTDNKPGGDQGGSTTPPDATSTGGIATPPAGADDGSRPQQPASTATPDTTSTGTTAAPTSSSPPSSSPPSSTATTAPGGSTGRDAGGSTAAATPATGTGSQAETHASAPPTTAAPATTAPTTSAPAATAPTTTAPASGGSSTTTASKTPAQLVDAGWSAIEGGDYAAARASFDAALAKSPGSPDARFGLGYAYEKLGNLPAAITQYCKVSKFGGGDARIESEGRLRALDASCD